MSTLRKSVQITGQDASVPTDIVSNQITATAAGIGNQVCWVIAATAADEGVQVRFSVPKNYVGTPKIIVKGILDGAPGASNTLGFGFRKRAVANNEAADAALDAEQTVSETIGSNGTNHSNEDEYQVAISLTAGDYAVDDTVYGYLYGDFSGTSYAGNFLLTGIEFEYADA